MKKGYAVNKKTITEWSSMSFCTCLSSTTQRMYFQTPDMRKPHRFFPAFLLFLLLLGVSEAGECSRKEDFEFLNQTFDNTRLVNSGEDLVKSYSVFFLSTLACFEARYWFLEYVRKGLNPDSELNSYSPDIIEIASIWTATSVIRNGNYTDWPRNGVLHGFVKTGGILQTVIAGVLSTRGRITIPALILVFISAESLAEMVSGTFTTLTLRKENVDPGKISTEQYDIGESRKSVFDIGWSIGITIFELSALIQISPETNLATYSTIALLSGTAAGADITGLLPRISDLIIAVIFTIVVVVELDITTAAAAASAGFLAAVGSGVAAAAGAVDAGLGSFAARDLLEAVTLASVAAGTSTAALLILVRSSPVSDTRYSRVAATITVASIFAFLSSIANYLNRGVPLDETFSEISRFYWKKAFELVHTPIDYLWTVFYGQ